MAATAAATATSFVGAGGQAMLQCAAQQSTWMQTAGAFAQKSAATITEGTRQYGTAAASTIPFPTVVANRVREATLKATNIIGQTPPAIAEANAEYAEYWGQNAGAMMGYLAGITGLISSLGVPLPVMPGAANPAAPAAAGVAAAGMSLGLQGAGAALSGATQAGTTAATTGTSAAATRPRWSRPPPGKRLLRRPDSQARRRVLPARVPLPRRGNSRPTRRRRCSRPRE